MFNWLKKHGIFLIIFLGNIMGAALGFLWYEGQLERTPVKYWLFTPDCPEFALFFSLVILGFWINRRSRVFEIITWFGLIKYGIWTMVTIGLFLTTVKTQQLAVEAAFIKEEIVLFVAHLCMLLEGLWLTRHICLIGWGLAATVGWFITADYFDWVVGVFPNLPYPAHLSVVRAESVVSTFLLSSVLLGLYLYNFGNNRK